ncbi:MAG: hypothetical protein KDC88_01700 [Ignavibacteriae bacterium]|nr:hypothetical protein [Ignavibacteriota bacterium]MCB9206439.1 hypothetical protein [Ignavibacteriales bacterium]MCB9210691.1 hypothetical protein [Ignavibacteriales bacterium]MCB9219652.1 hypothetical protein [Ignavibacteriales bacterium]MCB9259960.1 hypothetical protein [Ignavibacteriales bacterium]
MTRHFLVLILILFTVQFFAQVTPETQGYRDDEYGDIQYRREGVMDGNLVRTLFYNNGEVGQWPFQPSGEWPKGTGHSYLDGVAVLIAAQVLAPGNQTVITPLETSYREWMDKDPVTGRIWGLEPVPGYSNVSSTNPAISSDPNSWPDLWPRALPNINSNWDGFWYGYFGRGVINSDFETFFVMDDSKDGEFTRAPYNYYPIDSDNQRGGLGLRTEVRGFQWSHVLAEDIIFWHYDIINISDHDYDNAVFGFYTDSGVGGTNDSGDDFASFDTKLDLTYAYDDDGFGVPGRWITGYYGYAYLESPGIGSNGIDDDEDGIVDERRDDGIDNDGDWVPYLDINGNGKWDAAENEPLNNDVGVDGVGPFDPQYDQPDEGEGDGVPTNGEPNFDKTDIDESDMIGLTSLSIYRLGDGGTGGGWPKDDQTMWLKMNYANFDTSLQNANISMVFASGPFPLKKNLRERYSMALVFGNNLEDLVFNKETVQQIYNANYNFAKPPLKPTLTAVPGDGKVFLYWDGVAEESRDPFLGYEGGDPTQGYKKDFEGYLVYRSTEAEFNDIKLITDSKGEPKYWKPIAQFDLDNDISGPDPIGVNGASFWRGSNTGLQHSYVDEDVKNGQKYYYALVSYDQGDPLFGTKGLTPSECTKIITEDFTGTITFIDYNCAVVTPNAPSIGYVPAEIEGDISSLASGIGTGNMSVNILNSNEIIEGANYKVMFESEGEVSDYQTSAYRIIRSLASDVDTLIKVEGADISSSAASPPFDGMTVTISNDTSVAVDFNETGWLVGESNLTILVSPDSSAPARNVSWPSDYKIKWYDEVVATTPFFKIPVNFKITDITNGDSVAVELFDNDGNKELSIGDLLVIIQYPDPTAPSKYFLSWKIEFFQPAGIGYQPIYPQAGDEFFLKTTKQFATGDYFAFSTKASSVDENQAKEDLKKISVVPNPYIGQASWERRNLNQTGRGERRIDFINLPAECTIKIYTVEGSLVKTLTKTSGPTDGTVSWNLVTEDGMDVAYGLYVYHVDAPKVGEHIGKFALIK